MDWSSGQPEVLPGTLISIRATTETKSRTFKVKKRLGAGQSFVYVGVEIIAVTEATEAEEATPATTATVLAKVEEAVEDGIALGEGAAVEEGSAVGDGLALEDKSAAEDGIAERLGEALEAAVTAEAVDAATTAGTGDLTVVSERGFEDERSIRTPSKRRASPDRTPSGRFAKRSRPLPTPSPSKASVSCS
jgi:hypothetical protein